MAGTLWTSRVAGEEATVGVRLDVWSPSGCPGSADFVRAVEKRGVRLRVLPRDERALTIDVSISAASDGVLGRLALVDSDGRRSERTVMTANCIQATEALALIAALALHQAVAGDLAGPSLLPASSTATPSPATASTPAAAPDSSGTPSPSSRQKPPSARDVPSALTSTEDAAPAGIDANRGAFRSTAVTAWTFEASAAGLGAAGLGPDVIAGAALRIGATAPRHGSAWNPSLRISVEDTLDRSFSSSLGTATFGMLAASTEICPLAVFGIGAATLRPCASVEFGALRASGSETSNPRNEPRPWSAAGFEGTYSAPIAGPIFWDATLGALVPIDRYRFTIGPGTVFETPLVVARVALGIGAKID
jgi:hypothetical protein